MPRAERLPSRLDTLLDKVFAAPSDPFSLYWDIAGQLRRDQLARVQTKIRKMLRQKGEIGAESAVLLACILHLTGFPAHRILHFLSLYVPGGIRLALFELAVSAIFLDEPPMPAGLLYDLTQYTYLEKRLLVRRSMEISDTLKASLTPAVLLFLYLLSLRDDLSNENVQLIALIMKNCFPAQEVRTRMGGASLQEYGEIARAWKKAEGRSLDLEISPGSGAGKHARPFDRDSASFFLDKYFSDEALAEMRASAPSAPVRRIPPRPAAPPARSRRPTEEEARAAASPPHAVPTVARAKSRESAAPAPREDGAAVPEQSARLAGKHAAGRRGAAPVIRRAPQFRKKTEQRLPAASGAVPRTSAPRSAVPRTSALRSTVPTVAASRSTAPRGVSPVHRELLRRLLFPAPTVCAAVVIALILVLMTAGPERGAVSPVSSPAAPAQAALPVAPTSPPSPPPPPPTRTYIVRPGDSLWKIFTSMSTPGIDRRGWMDFLSKAQALNSLGDPDRLQPGKVLTLSPQQ